MIAVNKVRIDVTPFHVVPLLVSLRVNSSRGHGVNLSTIHRDKASIYETNVKASDDETKVMVDACATPVNPD